MDKNENNPDVIISVLNTLVLN